MSTIHIRKDIRKDSQGTAVSVVQRAHLIILLFFRSLREGNPDEELSMFVCPSVRSIFFPPDDRNRPEEFNPTPPTMGPSPSS